MIASELLRLRFSLVARIIGILVVAEAVFIGLLLVLLPSIIDGLIALNEVIPNATDADQLDPSQLAALSLDAPATQEVIIDLLGNSGTGSGLPAIAALLIGALTITTEHRRGSLTASALAEPRRAQLLLAKMTALALTVIAGVVVLVVIRGLLLTIGLAIHGAPLQLDTVALAGLWGKGALALVLYAAIGFAIGLLARSPVTVIIVLGAAIIVESVIRPITLLIVGTPNPALFLPFGLVPDISGTNPLAALTGSTVTTTGITPITAMLALAAWAIIAAAVASIRFVRTDAPDLQ
ncbi:MAG: ABC transporter permease subunit [Brachybacterium tyrofermentans]|uniref:ABC transporter permease subunit n=2 Tax=Dermabacteraceae TaxID=85020 RepID=UPI00186827EB|nr:ABC transporter permease subunit [Brachybacterium tyrofermentans]